MPKTYYLDGALINAALRQIPYTPPLASYVALFTTSPTQSGGGIEVVSGGGYGRQSAVWTAPVSGQSSNVAAVIFPVATGSWGTITSFALMDAPTAGNVLYYANLNASQTININDQVQFPVGQLQVIED
jgi:hypothetical protein